MTNYTKNLTTYPHRELSQYAKFHCTFQGQNFRNIKTGKVLKKGSFWDLHRHDAILSTKSAICPDGYELIDNDGWRNGKLV